MGFISVLLFLSFLPPLLILLAFPYRGKFGTNASIVFTISLCILIGIYLLYFGQSMVYRNMKLPREWDFLAFWTFAQVGNSGLDFYKPENFQALQLPWTATKDFILDTLDVGFLYPPATMFLFLPLAWFGLTQGFLLWYAAIFGAMATSIVLLWKLFLKNEGFPGLAFSAALVVFFPPTKFTLHYGQTLFFALCALLIFWGRPKSMKGGASLGIGLLIKPLFAVLLLVPAVKKSWRTLAGFFAVTSALWILAILYFGFGTVHSYFTEKPQAKFPFSVYLEPVNQSVSSLFLKMGYMPIGLSPVLTYPYIIVTLIMLFLTAWAVFRCPNEESEWALCLTVLLALLIYPGSQTHYGVLGLPAVFLIWKNRQRLRGGPWTIPISLSAIYAVDGLGFVLVGNMILWISVLILSPGLPWSKRTI